MTTSLQPAGSEQRIRVGVLGLGLIAQAAHLPNLQLLFDRFRISHLCDASPSLGRTVAAQLAEPVRTSTDWRELCSDPDLDAMVVLTPGGHGEPALAGLRAGKHVFTEKPLCVTQEEARQLADAADAAGRVLQVGYMKMYDPIIERARTEMSRLGRIRVVRVTVLHPTDEVQYQHLRLKRFGDADPELVTAARDYAKQQLRNAIGDVPLGVEDFYRGILLGSVVHETALLRALGMALPSRYSYADARRLDASSTSTEPPCLLAVADIADSAQLQLAWNWLPDYPEYTEEVAIFGSAGRLYLDMPGPYLPAHRARLRVEDTDGVDRVSATYRRDHLTGFVKELEAFADAINGTAPVRSTAAGAGEDIRSLQALLATVATRWGVTLGGEAAQFQDPR